MTLTLITWATVTAALTCLEIFARELPATPGRWHRLVTTAPFPFGIPQWIYRWHCSHANKRPSDRCHGGANGIGQALCRRFAAEGVAPWWWRTLTRPPRPSWHAIPAGSPCEQMSAGPTIWRRCVAQVTQRFGQIDLFCSNAGIETGGGIDAPDEAWQRIWSVNVMAHIYAARAVLPGMIARGRGYLLQTASAAGLLTQMTSAPYSATKHAAVGLADWLAITYADAGIKVSCLCPLGVRTNMLMGTDDPIAVFLRQDAIDPEQVAEAVVRGLAEERFLILPHPEVADFFRRKADDYDRWLRGMQRLRQLARHAQVQGVKHVPWARLCRQSLVGPLHLPPQFSCSVFKYASHCSRERVLG